MIKPSHFFLGILKVVETDLGKVLKSQRKDVLQEVKCDIADLKSCVGEFLPDLTYYRRFLRGILPKAGDGPCSGRLRRSKSSRLLFAEAEAAAQRTCSPVLPTHLLLALLYSDDAQIRTLLEKDCTDICNLKKYVAGFVSRSRKLSPKP